MDQLEQLIHFLLNDPTYLRNGLAGAVAASLVVGLIGGKGFGGIVKIVLIVAAGILGYAAGDGAGYGVAAVGYGDLLGGSSNAAMGYLQDLLEGGIGGGVLGLILSFIKGK